MSVRECVSVSDTDREERRQTARHLVMSLMLSLNEVPLMDAIPEQLTQTI